MRSLRALAKQLDIPERTLRRAAAEGLVRGERVSARRFALTMREEMYLREHWPMLRVLREALRTEPAVRLAILFGSSATGRMRAASDVDILIATTDEGVSRVPDLADKLAARVGRDVHLVLLDDALRSAVLMQDVVEHGRVLADREGRWPRLVGDAPRWRRRARRERATTAAAAYRPIASSARVDRRG